MKRISLAFLLAPLPAAFLQSVVVAVWPKEGMGVFEHPASMFVAICVCFYLVEIIVAVPLYLAMRKRLPRKMATYGLAAALMMLTPIVVGLAISVGRGGLSTYAIVYNFAFFALGGFLAGIVFWCVAVPRTQATLS